MTRKKKKTTKVVEPVLAPVLAPVPEDEDEEHGSDNVKKLSEVDTLRFGKLDAEMRNHMQGIHIANLEIDKINSQSQVQVKHMETQREQLKLLVEGLRPQFEAFIEELAAKHGISDPKNMVVDPETGTIRDTKTDL